MKNVAIVVSDEGLGGITPFGRALANRGHLPVLLAGPATAKDALASAADIYAHVQVLHDIYSPNAIAEAARSLGGMGRISACFSCYDGLVVTAAEAAKQLGLPHPALDGLVASRHKGATRRLTSAAGIPSPRWAYIRDAADAAAAADQVGFPAVIKPVNGMASHLVRCVEDARELHETVNAILERLRCNFAGNYGPALVRLARTAGEPDDAVLLLEERLTGDEFSAEVLVRGKTIRRIALFEKWKMAPRGFLECGFTMPPLHAPGGVERIWLHIEDCLTALGVNDAAAHVEVMDSPDGVRLLEVNAGRAGGQILVLATRRVTGTDLIEEIVSIACGEPSRPPVSPDLAGRVSTMTVFPNVSGRLVAIDGLDTVAGMPGVQQVVPFVAPGTTIDCDDKEVFAVNVLVSGGDGPSLDRLYAEICRAVTLKIEPIGAAPESRDGRHAFAPTTTIGRLSNHREARSTAVRVAGRISVDELGVTRLHDAGEAVVVRFAQPESIPAHAWIGVEATWDPIERVLQRACVLFRRDPELPLENALADALPEAQFISDPSRLGALRSRARLVALLRRELSERGFLEVQTPFLHLAPENANVTQYSTMNCIGKRLFLRTDPEEYLKRYLTAGLESVYEVACNVRGDKVDVEHLEEFTSLEAYRRFATLDQMMQLTYQLIFRALSELRGSADSELRGRRVMFQLPPRVRSVHESVLEATGIDLSVHLSATDLAHTIDLQGLGRPALPPFRGTWIEWLIDRHVLSRLEVPTYLTDFPPELGISSCAVPRDSLVCLRAELYLPGGLELAHVYENVTEPAPLAERLRERRERRLSHGYDDIVIDGELIASASLGMPPMAGLALGVDRLLMLVLGCNDVGAGLLFPREGQSADRRSSCAY